MPGYCSCIRRRWPGLHRLRRARKGAKSAAVTQELNLAPDQQRQIEAIIASVQVAVQAIRHPWNAVQRSHGKKGRGTDSSDFSAGTKAKVRDFCKRLDEERKRTTVESTG